MIKFIHVTIDGRVIRINAIGVECYYRDGNLTRLSDGQGAGWSVTETPEQIDAMLDSQPSGRRPSTTPLVEHYRKLVDDANELIAGQEKSLAERDETIQRWRERIQDLVIERDYWKARASERAAEVDNLRGVIEGVEWTYQSGYRVCARCGSTDIQGHKLTCPVGRALGREECAG